jgi:hypothetical protein
MQTENIDSFIEFLYSVEEAETVLTADQVQKLTLIQTKVSELVAKVNQNIPTQQISQMQMQPMLAAVSEKKIHGFQEFLKKP